MSAKKDEQTVKISNMSQTSMLRQVCPDSTQLKSTNQNVAPTEEALRAALHEELDYYKELHMMTNMELDEVKWQLATLQSEYDSMSNSFFWKITKPARWLLDVTKAAIYKQKPLPSCYNVETELKEGLNKKDKLSDIIDEGIPTDHYEDNVSFKNYKTDIKAVALYLPQFHTIPENDEWWGKGFTEWTNVKKGAPRYEGHYQPRIPHDDIGYYDLSDIETLKKQVKLAKEHGLYGFAIYYYWFSGHRLLEKPLDLLLEHKEIDFPFMAIWANENWTRVWDGAKKDILIKQKYQSQDPESFILDLKKYIDDERYIRMDGKPVIGLYQPMAIPRLKKVLQTWRDTAEKCGIGPILIWVCSNEASAHIWGIEDIVDGEYEFPPRTRYDEPYCEFPNKGKVLDYKAIVGNAKTFTTNNRKIPVYRGVMLRWDNSARRAKKYNIWCNFSNAYFYLWLRIEMAYLRKNFDADHRFLFVNAWNEWGEGTYLEPDKEYGYASINTLSRALMDLPLENVDGAASENTILYLGACSPFDKGADWDQALQKDCQIAVQAHVFYPELLEEVVEYTNHIPYPFDLYISTTDQTQAQTIAIYVENHSNARTKLVQVFTNKGRDVAPFILQMQPVISNYQYICHIHTKKSMYSSSLGDSWRSYLFSNLLGDKDMVKEIFWEFVNNPKLGVIFPENLKKIRPQVEWGSNKENVEALLRQMHKRISLPETAMFPAGNMLWARVDAVKDLFALNWTEADFPEEAGQEEATIMHAVERVWFYLAKANGYSYQRTRNIGDNEPFD